MKKTVNMWVDRSGKLGILEMEDAVFGQCFRPILLSSLEKREYRFIKGLWYTTYSGARQFFRQESNPYQVQGRMRKIPLEEPFRQVV
ncbi:hypothetical protein [Thalassobacillus pellis]|uniref:hypothetical protein n=1 Tax=Thalassobacillus pellis TaxID=748008 RepID=UPI001961DB72|nr:hypothetical protein [Thalassobacillus pellis]MBM7554508.1 hypothetical protein [Thalassobacillus pellis]